MLRFGILLSGLTLLTALGVGCRHGTPGASPTTTQPRIRSRSELAAGQEERSPGSDVRSGNVPQPASRPGSPSPRTRPALLLPTPDAIRADILLVNDSVLTVPEVLYPLRERVAEARATLTRRRFREQVRRWVRTRVQQEIGALLIYREAHATLSPQQIERLDQAAEHSIDQRVVREFGGSSARLEKHLARYGLTLDTYREMLRRELLVQSYTRETLMPRVFIRRDELLEYYREHIDEFSKPQTRELFMIALPFEAFLPRGQTWATATGEQRSQARLAAMRAAQQAHRALQSRPFEDVARQFSRGLRAAQGGAWGPIGQPLQPPYRQASQRIFQMQEGQISEPIETETGWFIVKCGRIEGGTSEPFVEVQDRIRRKLTDERFNRLAADYVLRLAEKATISDLRGFIDAAVKRATGGAWPAEQ